MIDLSELILDSDFCQPYIGYRTSGSFVDGVFVGSESIVNFVGPIIAANVKDVNMVPEGDRVVGMMVFYTQTNNPFHVSQSSPDYEGISDYLVWNNERYKILSAYPYNDYGYLKCVASRISGA